MSANRLAQDPKRSVLCLGCDGVSVFGEDILKMPMYLPEQRYRVGIWAADQVVDVGLWVFGVGHWALGVRRWALDVVRWVWVACRWVLLVGIRSLIHL